jgi:hypothetical protein
MLFEWELGTSCCVGYCPLGIVRATEVRSTQENEHKAAIRNKQLVRQEDVVRAKSLELAFVMTVTKFRFA